MLVLVGECSKSEKKQQCQHEERVNALLVFHSSSLLHMFLCYSNKLNYAAYWVIITAIAACVYFHIHILIIGAKYLHGLK